jgi:hypothetical protein
MNGIAGVGRMRAMTLNLGANGSHWVIIRHVLALIAPMSAVTSAIASAETW